jgi:hypothetical protein
MGHFSVKIIAPDGSNLNGNQHRLPEIIKGVEFRDGIRHEIKAA